MREDSPPVHLIRIISRIHVHDWVTPMFDVVYQCRQLHTLGVEELSGAIANSPTTQRTFEPRRATCPNCKAGYEAHRRPGQSYPSPMQHKERRLRN